MFLQNAFFWYFPTQLLNIIAILASQRLVVNKAVFNQKDGQC